MSCKYRHSCVPTQEHPNHHPENCGFLPPFISRQFCFISQELFQKPICQGAQKFIDPSETCLWETQAPGVAPLYAQGRITETVKPFWFRGLCTQANVRREKKFSHNKEQNFHFQNKSLFVPESVNRSSSSSRLNKLSTAHIATLIWI